MDSLIGGMKLIDNVNQTLRDDLSNEIKSGSKVSIAAASFSIYAYQELKHCKELGRYICKGFDTYGPFKLVGGLQKGHPTDEEIQAAVDFYNAL